MLVLCVGMYRACSTWQYGVVGALLEKHRDGQRLGFVEGIYLDEKLDVGRWANDWAVLKAHDAHDGFSALVATRRALGLYAHRDLRDVVASYMHKTGTGFESLMERGFVELCLHNDRSWRSQPGVLVQRYDDLIADPAEGVRQIAAHLGIDLEAGEAEAVADALSWEANRRKVESMSARLVEEGATLAAADQSRFDPVSLLHWNHIRPVGSGADSRRLNPRQARLVERLAAAWLAANGYEVASPAGADATAEPEPVARTSFARSGLDIRLDRVFRGTRGNAVDFDAPHPRVANPSYYLYRRGWRMANVGTTPSPRDRFVVERPTDLNLACRLDAHRAEADGIMTLDDLLTTRRIAPPDLVVLNPASATDRILATVLASDWRPRIVVVDPSEADADAAAPAWRSRLETDGYLPVPGLAGPAIFVRGDLADIVATLSRPLGPDDRSREADWGAEFAELEARPQPEPPAPPEPPAESPDAWQGERNMFQAERDAWQRERDSIQRERDARQAERDAFHREREALRVQLDRAMRPSPGVWPSIRRQLGRIKRALLRRDEAGQGAGSGPHGGGSTRRGRRVDSSHRG